MTARRYGWRPDRGDHRDQKLQVPFFQGLWGLPSKADIGTRMPRVEDQGQIGSCVANASTSAMEYLRIKLGLQVTEFSRLFLYYITRVWIEKGQAGDDSGCQIRDAVKALARWGVCHEATWPYSKGYDQDPTGEAKREAEQHRAVHYWRCPSLRAIKVSLVQGYPVIGGFSVPESIDSEATRTTGIVAYPLPSEGYVGGHAVLFVGYDDATKLLKFENSWGKSWGDKGFGYLPYKYVETWLASDFWTVRKSTEV